VVLPAFNESEFLEPAVDTIDAGLRERGATFEIVVVENGSTDGTLEVARALQASHPDLRVLHHDEADYGAAMRAGVLEARGDTIVVFDVDYYDLGFLDRAVTRLQASDRPVVVVGSKRAPGARDERSPVRKLATAVFQTLLRVAFGLSVSDTHGMKALRRDEIQPLAAQCRFRTDLFDTELILRAERAGLPVAEIPVAVRELRPARTSIFRRVPRTLAGLVRLRVLMGREVHPVR
jgi:glycosyltransferase involved in cell wall biosynthesis